MKNVPLSRKFLTPSESGTIDTLSTQFTAMLRLSQDWVRIFCETIAESNALKEDWRMMIPIYIRSFRSMIKEGVKSIPCVEIISADSHTPTYVTVSWNEMDPILDGCIAKLEAVEDYEECQELIDLKRDIQEAELVGSY